MAQNSASVDAGSTADDIMESIDQYLDEVLTRKRHMRDDDAKCLAEGVAKIRRKFVVYSAKQSSIARTRVSLLFRVPVVHSTQCDGVQITFQDKEDTRELYMTKTAFLKIKGDLEAKRLVSSNMLQYKILFEWPLQFPAQLYYTPPSDCYCADDEEHSVPIVIKPMPMVLYNITLLA